MLVSSILSVVWHGRLAPQETLHAAVVAYHFVQLHMSEAHHRFVDDYEQALSAETVKNCLYLAGHAILATLAHTSEHVWDLATRQEFVSKVHFSTVKSGCRGACSIRDGLYGTLLWHSQQMADLLSCRR